MTKNQCNKGAVWDENNPNRTFVFWSLHHSVSLPFIIRGDGRTSEFSGRYADVFFEELAEVRLVGQADNLADFLQCSGGLNQQGFTFFQQGDF